MDVTNEVRYLTYIERAAREFAAFKRVADLFGLTRVRALIAANRATRKRTGIDFQVELGIKRIPEEDGSLTISKVTFKQK